VSHHSACFDVSIGFVHHLLESRIGFNLVESFFHVGLELNRLASDHAAVARTVRS
jgi:hypothetical protein